MLTLACSKSHRREIFGGWVRGPLLSVINMEIQQEILSDITTYMKYSKYDSNKQRRETWPEIVSRNMQMHIEKFPEFRQEISDVYINYVLPKKVLPSMRSMQFAGKAIDLSPNRVYNCAYMPIDSIHSFSEAMFLLLGGTGVGYSVQRHHINKLPTIKERSHIEIRYKIQDSIEGWADAIYELINSYAIGGNRLKFDYRDIRPEGSLLKTSGGRSPNPKVLEDCINNIEAILELVVWSDNKQLTSLQCHDIMCYIADAVLAGGIRRAAMISLFSPDDELMLHCKDGEFWNENSQRMRANNSAVFLRNDLEKNDSKKEAFHSIWNNIAESGTGEPAFYLTNDIDWGTNPCCEIALRPYQFCNLTEINASNIESYEDLKGRVSAATILGTLQASYTDFHYLRPVWKMTTEKDALIGVSMTGIASKEWSESELKEMSNVVVSTNHLWANKLGINPAARTTCVKPAGTTSLVLGTSSGIHSWHSEYYIRRIRVLKSEPIYEYLRTNLPDLVEDCVIGENQAVISIPQKSPKGAITREESTLEMLERVKLFSQSWVKKGHVTGFNTHNVSATINVKDGEWDMVGKWLWDNRDTYNGLSVLPYDGGLYAQAPFEEISKEDYKKLLPLLKEIDLTKIVELTDNTTLQGEIACAGGACEI